MIEDFDITKPPKAGSDEVGPWFWQLFGLCKDWRDGELGMPERWRASHSMYRGDHWGTREKKNSLSVNLPFANINRTVANVTARKPVAEVVDLDGKGGNLAKAMTAKIKKWWLDTKQSQKLRTTTNNSEIYGITWEKSTWNASSNSPNVVVCDPFSQFPYPGVWENFATDCPAHCHATALEPGVIQQFYGTTEDIETSDTYSLLGGEREEVTGVSNYGTTSTSQQSSQGYETQRVVKSATGIKGDKALMVECWIRDWTKDKDGNHLYPGGIRCVVITNEGRLVLSDAKHPSLNWEVDLELLKKNYLFSRFPFYLNNSYQDSVSLFGFSANEVTAKFVQKIDELYTRILIWAMKTVNPMLVIPPKCGINAKDIGNKPNLIVFPETDEGAAGIRYVTPPSPPARMFEVLDRLVATFDRIYAIEDIDRGAAPSGVTAASAIVAMQERNAVLVQHKIDGIDTLVAERGNYAVAQWQMHGHKMESIAVDDDTVEFKPDQTMGFNFNYVVESGSTMAKTSLQLQEQSVALAKEGFIDRQALLENINFPDAGKIIERMAEKDVDAAIQILIQAGLPQDVAMEIAQLVLQPQGGPGNREQKPPMQPQPGIPKAQQGEMA
ncbi:MAG: hypothetical protein GY820_38985 [Gammaproteobacteria bacterium]|nr:hypothetical protein [Gammaproteobacteria bacterium]